jgi:cholesterol transport system auxiliary component
MRSIRKSRAATAAILLLLAGCGGLLGGGERADLYRFGAAAPPTEATFVPVAAPSMERPALVLFVGANFERAIAGDRILTVTGAQAGYVAEARWVSPAADLFDAAARQALETRMTSARVVRLRGSPMPDYALGIDVRRFEADYAAGPEAPPDIVLEARARLLRWTDRSIVAEWPVSVRQPAAQNRMPSLVDAFDRATAEAVTRIADGAEQALAGQPRLAQRGGE